MDLSLSESNKGEHFTMGRLNMRLFPHFLIVAIICVVLSSCRNQSPSLQVSPPNFNAHKSGTRAVDLYDVNGDELLSADELKACPGIAGNIELYDKSGDGQVSADEIAARVQQWVKLGGSFLPLRCTVLLDGRPLPGANLELDPEPLLGDVLKHASGVTGIDGTVEVSVKPEEIPEQLRGLPVVQPGLYKVRITHPKHNLLAKYNTQTSLGCEVSPQTANPSKAVQFVLKSK